jgi:hypothetical protein
MWIYLSNGQLKWIIYTERFTRAVCLSEQENILSCLKEGIKTKPWIRNIIISLFNPNVSYKNHLSFD